jgi:hypothetical protein
MFSDSDARGEAPVATGFVVDRTGHFFWAFAHAAAFAGVGAASYLWIVGPIKQVVWGQACATPVSCCIVRGHFIGRWSTTIAVAMKISGHSHVPALQHHQREAGLADATRKLEAGRDTTVGICTKSAYHDLWIKQAIHDQQTYLCHCYCQ